jgi:Amidohydrolase family
MKLLPRWATPVLALAVCATPTSAQKLDDYVFENVTVIDGTGRAPIEGASVHIRGDRIVEVAQGPLTVGPEVRHIDASGKYLIPGLMDMHIHLRGGRGPDGPDVRTGIRALHGFLYSGVTSVFDAGNIPDFIFDLRARERAGDLVSPRIFATGGLVTTPGGHGGGAGATLVDRWPEDKTKLDEHIAREPDMVKLTFDEHGWGTRPLIPLLDPDLMAKVGAYFNEHGIRTTVHISH